MNISHPHSPVRPYILAQRLFKLERCGKYEEGLAETRDIWPDTSALPNFEGFDTAEAAELLLRCGALFGFADPNPGSSSAQDTSKNLLTDARERFVETGNIEKVAECENYLALAYWRSGELNEGESFVEIALTHDLPGSNSTRLFSLIARTLIYLSGRRFVEIVKLLVENEYDFIRNGDAFLLGCFNSNLGVALRNLGRLDEALERHKMARVYHEKSGHKIYLATVDNNLVYIYTMLGEFGLAHSSSDNATQIFRRLKDKTREGFSIDTKATIYIDEGKYSEAVKTADKAIARLRQSENASYRIEAMMTKVKAMVLMNNVSEAAFCLSEAVNTALSCTGEDAARKLTDRFEALVNERALNTNRAEIVVSIPAIEEKKAKSFNDLQLVLPPSIAHYADYQGVWINGTHLERAGLNDGSLAIVANVPVTRGEIAALTTIDGEILRCGIYDKDFGIISLEGLDDSGPSLFDEEEVRILGRIVGVCNSGNDAEGKMIVEEVNL